MTRNSVLQPAVHAEDHAIGPANAPVTLVEYGDYQCPYCAKAHRVVGRLRQQFGENMRLVFRNFPLSEIHPHARQAAEAAESVQARHGADAFWAMHDAIFTHQRANADSLDEAHLLGYAAAIGADVDQVRADMQERMFEQRIRGDFLSGVRSGVNGTPTFFINGVRFAGDWTDEEPFGTAIRHALAGPHREALRV